MPSDILGADVSQALADAQRRAAQRSTKTVTVDGKSVQIQSPIPSPAGWGDCWIYFLMIDRFNNHASGRCNAGSMPKIKAKHSGKRLARQASESQPRTQAERCEQSRGGPERGGQRRGRRCIGLIDARFGKEMDLLSRSGKQPTVPTSTGRVNGDGAAVIQNDPKSGRGAS